MHKTDAGQERKARPHHAGQSSRGSRNARLCMGSKMAGFKVDGGTHGHVHVVIFPLSEATQQVQVLLSQFPAQGSHHGTRVCILYGVSVRRMVECQEAGRVGDERELAAHFCLVHMARELHG